MRRLWAMVFLGWQFVLHWFRRLRWLLRGRPDQLALFTNYYREDGILPTSPAERDVQWGLQRCIHCGLCAFDNPAFLRMKSEYNLSPAALAIALSRSQPEFAFAEDWVAELEGVKVNPGACPQGVPLQAAADLIRQKITELKRKPV